MAVCTCENKISLHEECEASLLESYRECLENAAKLASLCGDRSTKLLERVVKMFVRRVHMKLFSAVPTLLIAPVLASSLFIGSISEDAQATALNDPRSKVESSRAQLVSETVSRSLVQRRLRIERLLVSLDSIAEVALQMKPETTQRLEPVIVDLAEQTLSLVGGDEIQNVKTDSELDRLELTVSQLVGALNKMIEPEMSL